jgi:hypothetical protein
MENSRSYAMLDHPEVKQKKGEILIPKKRVTAPA